MRRLLLLLLVLASTGCGPAFRFRPAETLPKGTVEVAVGIGAAARAESGEFGGSELVGMVRGGVDPKVEVGGRFWTYSFATFGGGFDVRVQLVRGPIDLTLDGGLVAGGCCGAAGNWKILGAALGLDGGFTLGKRFGGAMGPAFYIAPHVQGSWTIPTDQNWPVQLFLPVGADIPVPKTPLRIRPEFLVVGLFTGGDQHTWRVGGGIALALQGPGPKRVAEQRKKSREAKEEEELAAYRKAMGLPPR
jgi:hypothetical protein